MSVRPLRLFSIVFNEQYIDWFDRACVPSLSWPSNSHALRRAVAWDVWTTTEDAERVRQIAERVGVQVEIHAELEPASWENKEPLKLQLTRALTAQIERAAAERSAFLWIAPDSVFGDGSIRSILELGAPPDVCVALAPMRVQAAGFIEAMGPRRLLNDDLVSLAFKFAHRSFVEAEATLPMTNSFDSGVSWRTLRPGRLYAVTHRKHSAYLMQPTARDAESFRGMKKFGAYDHSFPRRLIEEQRQRVIGSSDAAFVVELTPELAHVPPLYAMDPDEPDRFNQNMPHHAANRNVVAIWRAA